MLYMKGHVDDHVLHIHVFIVRTMLTELLYPLQDGYTPLYVAVREGHATCVERLLSTPGIDVNIKNVVSWYTGHTHFPSHFIGTHITLPSQTPPITLHRHSVNISFMLYGSVR